MESPNVASIHENGAVDDVEDGEPVFGIELQLQVACLLNVLCDRHIATWADGAIKPSAQAVGAAAIEATLEGHVFGVSVGDTNADELAEDEPVFVA